MAKLSTPYHECAITYADSNGVAIYKGGRPYHCQYAAYRQFDGRWLCKKHWLDSTGLDIQVGPREDASWQLRGSVA